MNAPHIDPELLAAVLDGTATPDEREQVLRLIAGSREAYAEFREATAIREGLHEDVARGEVSAVGNPATDLAESPSGSGTPSRAGKNRFRYLFPVAMLAAAGVAIVVVSRQKSGGAERSVVEIAQAMRVEGASGSGSLARTLGADWDVPGWTVTRGVEAQLPTSARAFRAGVRLGQLEISVSASDTVAVSNAARELQSLLRDVSGSAPVFAQLDVMVNQQHVLDTVGSRAALASQIKDLIGEAAWFEFGVWIAAAQTAARNGNAVFFQAEGASLATLDRLLVPALIPRSEGQRQALDALRELGRNGARGAGEFGAVRGTLARFARAVGE